MMRNRNQWAVCWVGLFLVGCASDGSFSTGGLLPGYSNEQIAGMRGKLTELQYPQPPGTTASHLGIDPEKVSNGVSMVAHKPMRKDHVATSERVYRLNLWHVLRVTQAHLRDDQGKRSVVEMNAVIEDKQSDFE